MVYLGCASTPEISEKLQEIMFCTYNVMTFKLNLATTKWQRDELVKCEDRDQVTANTNRVIESMAS